MAPNQILMPIRRHIADLKKRIAKQSELVNQLAGSGRNIDQATRTLRILQTALALTREHLEMLTSVETRRVSRAPMPQTQPGDGSMSWAALPLQSIDCGK